MWPSSFGRCVWLKTSWPLNRQAFLRLFDQLHLPLAAPLLAQRFQIEWRARAIAQVHHFVPHLCSDQAIRFSTRQPARHFFQFFMRKKVTDARADLAVL